MAGGKIKIRLSFIHSCISVSFMQLQYFIQFVLRIICRQHTFDFILAFDNPTKEFASSKSELLELYPFAPLGS